ncbi:MAG TPA: hypothetical protein VFV67_25415 [Actinophytocola sp.]|uniref:hypothetical protein n=1 Tax=Actinophytocola sp. TaxID=1872138 RepID=UPI002DBBA84B|nr:hypothetical protein [Actinophytocola sp.]HEU5473999.1 hypothetical protein [Actinophytocola sp.]
MKRAGRGWFRLVAVLSALVLVCASCSNAVSGSPVPGTIPPLTAAESINQSLLNFGESGAVHYKGSLTSASDEKLGFEVTVSAAGEVLGQITLSDAPANILVINKTLYVKAPAAFWAALRGIGDGAGKGTAYADRWVKLPSVLLGVEFAEMFTPDAVSQDLAKQPTDGEGALADRPKSTESGVEVIKVPLDLGTLYLAAQPPHGLTKIALSKYGKTDNTRVSDLVVDVVDTSANSTAFYTDLAAQAGQLVSAVDALTTVQQGTHRFEGCGAESCSLIVEFTNTAKVPVRVHVKADWTGDNAPLGACEVQVGPVAPGQPGSATCTINSPEWVNFWQRAHSVAGTHPWNAVFAPLVLAEAPDLEQVTRQAQAKPADPKERRTEGSHYVYVINYGGKVWKYGVVASRYWRDHATLQLRTCLAANQAVCTFELVTATDNAGSAYALENQLVQKYQADNSGCPAGQWVSCKR